MRKHLLIGLSIIALAATGCQGGKAKSTAVSTEEVETVNVKVDGATTQQVAQVADFTATLQAYKYNYVVPMVAARIERIYVDVGDVVKEGDVLVDLDKNQYNQVAANLANMELTLTRMKPVYEAGGVSKREMDELETSISVMREQADNLKKNLQLLSPMDGVVTGRYNDEGDLYSMSPNSDGGVGIIRVMRMDMLLTKVALSEKYIPSVYIGMPVVITSELYPGQEFPGKVTRINPAINSTTRTFDVEVTIPNEKMTLRPGMYARTTFNMGEITGVTVKDLAVVKQPGTNDKYVYVIAKDNTAEKRKVTLGRQIDDRIEVVAGVKEGEQVAVAGLSKLKAGDKVKISK